MIRVRQLWTLLRASFWFVPSQIVAACIALSVALIRADAEGAGAWLDARLPMLVVGASGARGILSTIAGSMMTVVGITFSMTLVTLVLASSQYTSRILRNFMRDRVTHVALGLFAGIFCYCILVLRTINEGGTERFVPTLAVNTGVLLALLSIGILIYFLHHIALSIQASLIIADAAGETIVAIGRLFPERLEGALGEAAQPVPQAEDTWKPIASTRAGYIQSVDYGALIRAAKSQETVVHMARGIGQFVVQHGALAYLAQDTAPDCEAVQQIQAAFVIDSFRTVEQDPAFGIQQIVDIALRALSPGVNDTTTAVMCIDYLSAILAEVAKRKTPETQHYDGGTLRLIAVASNFDSLLSTAFDSIRENAAGNAAILLRLLGAFEAIAAQLQEPWRRRVLREHLDAVAEVAERSMRSPRDQQRVAERLEHVHHALDLRRGVVTE